MQTVAVEDELSCRLQPGGRGVRLSVEGAALPTDERNLVTRAARLVLERARRAAGVEIHLRKVLPLGGGLGGGSSDAAATILALNGLLKLGWGLATLMELGAEVGSDVPFFFGAPTAIVEGRGERVTPVQLIGDRWILLVCPDFRVQTKWAFDRVAEVRGRSKGTPRGATLGGKTPLRWEDVLPRMENDFEDVLAPVYPGLGEIKRQLLAEGAEAALLSGSGSTVFGIFPTEGQAEGGRVALGERGHWTATGRACVAPLRCVGPGSSPRLGVC